MIGIPLGLLVGNASEWVIHKYVLHGWGADKSSYWSGHWHDHHRNVRRFSHYDPDYAESVFQWNGPGREAFALTAATLTGLTFFPVAPFFIGTLAYCAFNYFTKHKRAHLDPAWGRKNLPWHYDHHMGPNQHANWCVTKPWFDQLMGTREPYVGTEREARDLARIAQKGERPRPEVPADKRPGLRPLAARIARHARAELPRVAERTRVGISERARAATSFLPFAAARPSVPAP